MNRIAFILALGIAVTGCGRKEAPQVVDPREAPSIASLTHSISGNSLKLDIKLAGGSEALGFQVDRARQEPGCKCPGFWRRYFEAPPLARQKGKAIIKLFDLHTHKKAYYFRVRAVDELGRLSPWSETIFAQAEEIAE